jgi:D-amino peptidase
LKIYVSVDMEGIAGIVLRSQIMRGELHYQEARRLLTDEVNAVVEGLVQGGAHEIIVKDAHGSGFNFIIEDLHASATYCLGSTTVAQRFPGLDSTFDGAILVGYHAMAGTPQAALEHTFSYSEFINIELNGEPVGEIALDGLLFGLHDVPVLLVTGDDKTCAEAFATLGPGVATYSTKVSTGRQSALIKPPKKVNTEMKEAIAQALANRNQCVPLRKQGPYEMIVHFVSTDLADKRPCDGIEAQRLDGRRIRYTSSDFTQLLVRAL